MVLGLLVREPFLTDSGCRLRLSCSSFIPSVKFPVTSMGFQMGNTCRLWGLKSKPKEPSLGTEEYTLTCFVVWKLLPGMEYLFIILVR